MCGCFGFLLQVLKHRYTLFVKILRFLYFKLCTFLHGIYVIKVFLKFDQVCCDGKSKFMIVFYKIMQKDKFHCGFCFITSWLQYEINYSKKVNLLYFLMINETYVLNIHFLMETRLIEKITLRIFTDLAKVIKPSSKNSLIWNTQTFISKYFITNSDLIILFL